MHGATKELSAPFLLKMTNKDLLYSTGSSIQCYVASWMRGEFGGEWIHVYVWLSSFCGPPEAITTLLISSIPIYNKSLKNECVIAKYENALNVCNQRRDYQF